MENLYMKNTAHLYYIKDHLGSNRMVVKVNSGVQQVQHYYPFGLSFAEATNRSYQPYKYNGKELVSDEGLNWYDYLARTYDPALPIFTTMDPMADKYYSISPYAYCGNNPVKYIDPTGKWIESAWDVFSLVTEAKSFVDNVKAGNVGAAIIDGVGVIADAVAVAVPLVPGGVGASIKGVRAVDNIVDAVNNGKKATTVTENAAKGKAFEKQVGESLGNNKASQVIIEAADGTRTKVDFVQKTDGKVTLTEAKGSQTAPLTKNQKTVHPQIETSGGTVRGNKGAEIGLPAGEKIPPTKVEIIRPEDLLNK